jgi:hypothetical protein
VPPPIPPEAAKVVTPPPFKHRNLIKKTG